MVSLNYRSSQSRNLKTTPLLISMPPSQIYCLHSLLWVYRNVALGIKHFLMFWQRKKLVATLANCLSYVGFFFKPVFIMVSLNLSDISLGSMSSNMSMFICYLCYNDYKKVLFRTGAVYWYTCLFFLLLRAYYFFKIDIKSISNCFHFNSYKILS